MGAGQSKARRGRRKHVNENISKVKQEEINLKRLKYKP